MIRILITLVVASVTGFGIGTIQSNVQTSGFDEQFAGSRQTQAEITGDISTEQLAAQSTGTPKVFVVDGNRFEFGVMQHGEEREHTFVIRNDGDGPLNLEMNGSTCKCTVGELEKAVLQPGESTNVKLTWIAQSIMPDFGQSANIATNDPEHDEITLEVVGQIADSYVVEPDGLSLGDVSVTDGIEREFFVFTYLEGSNGPEEFIWSEVSTKSKVSFSMEETEIDVEQFSHHRTALKAHRVVVKFDPGMPLGPLGGRIRFTTDRGEDVGALEIPIAGRVVGDITVIGGSSFDTKRNILDFGNVIASKGSSKTLWLKATGDARDKVQPEIVSVSPEEALQVTVGEPKESKGQRLFRLRFEVPAGAPEAYYSGSTNATIGKVVINTGHDAIPELRIFVRLAVVGPDN